MVRRLGLWLVAVLAVLPAGAQIPDAARRFQRTYVAIVQSEWGLDAPVAALAAQIHQESGWNCAAVSKAGAMGCAQFMPATAKWIGDVDKDLARLTVFDPVWAFEAQAVYMRWLAQRVNPALDACQRLAFAMQAYNGGLGWVQRRQRLSPEPGRCLDATCNLNPGITAANQREASEYPERILRRIEPRYTAAGWGRPTCVSAR